MSIRRCLLRFLVLLGLSLAFSAPVGSLAASEQPADSARTALAQDVQSDLAPFTAAVTPVSNDFPDSYGLLVRTGLSLVVVLVIIWGAVQIMRRFSGGTISKTRNTHIKVLDRTYLAPKKAIYVVRIGSRALAVGVTDSQVNPLADLDLEETLAAYPDGNGTGASQAFSTVYRNVRSRFASDPAREAS